MKPHTLIFAEADRARFEEIEQGSKKIETRATNEQYSSVAKGDEIIFTCGADSFRKRVEKIYHWPTVEAMLAEVPLEKVMPGLLTIEEVKERYAAYPGYAERIAGGGILGFELV